MLNGSQQLTSIIFRDAGNLELTISLRKKY